MAMSRKYDGWSEHVGMRREVTPPDALREAWRFARDLVITFSLVLGVYLLIHTLAGG